MTPAAPTAGVVWPPACGTPAPRGRCAPGSTSSCGATCAVSGSTATCRPGPRLGGEPPQLVGLLRRCCRAAQRRAARRRGADGARQRRSGGPVPAGRRGRYRPPADRRGHAARRHGPRRVPRGAAAAGRAGRAGAAGRSLARGPVRSGPAGGGDPGGAARPAGAGGLPAGVGPARLRRRTRRGPRATASRPWTPRSRPPTRRARSRVSGRRCPGCGAGTSGSARCAVLDDRDPRGAAGVPVGGGGGAGVPDRQARDPAGQSGAVPDRGPPDRRAGAAGAAGDGPAGPGAGRGAPVGGHAAGAARIRGGRGGLPRRRVHRRHRRADPAHGGGSARGGHAAGRHHGPGRHRAPRPPGWAGKTWACAQLPTRPTPKSWSSATPMSSWRRAPWPRSSPRWDAKTPTCSRCSAASCRDLVRTAADAADHRRGAVLPAFPLSGCCCPAAPSAATASGALLAFTRSAYERTRRLRRGPRRAGGGRRDCPADPAARTAAGSRAGRGRRPGADVHRPPRGRRRPRPRSGPGRRRSALAGGGRSGLAPAGLHRAGGAASVPALAVRRRWGSRSGCWSRRKPAAGTGRRRRWCRCRRWPRSRWCARRCGR